MPELLNRSPEEVLNAMARSWGTTWPNPWWPSGNSGYDDCVACVSYYLFGLNSFGNPYYTYVSQIQNWGRDRGVWHAGSDGGDPATCWPSTGMGTATRTTPRSPWPSRRTGPS